MLVQLRVRWLQLDQEGYGCSCGGWTAADGCTGQTLVWLLSVVRQQGCDARTAHSVSQSVSHVLHLWCASWGAMQALPTAVAGLMALHHCAGCRREPATWLADCCMALSVFGGHSRT